MNEETEEFGFERLKVWQVALSLVDATYTETSAFPKSETFGLSSQMRAAAVSIPSNISEGHGRSTKTFLNHLGMAIGSSHELRTQVEIAHRLGYLDTRGYDDLLAKTREVSRMIAGLRKSLEKGNQS